MSRLKVILVDDESAARNVLTNLLQRCCGNVDIVASCEDVLEAVKCIKKFKPDLVFLDVQMPNYAGYEIVNFFDEIDFEIVFVTAFDQYAIKAFELSAIDYIIKPVARHRLDEAIKKVERKLTQRATIENYQLLLESMRGKELGKIVLSELSDGKLNKHILHLKDIISIEAMGAYCKVYLMNDASFLVSRNLKYFESLLPSEAPFFRSHRSWVVNLDHVVQFNPRSGIVQMKNDITAKISKNRLELFEKATNV
ncbi:MAG: two-component system LytT family response regulator [Crocinitomicaceae bacterium]|jgi:two-component system LytT family response regulator